MALPFPTLLPFDLQNCPAGKPCILSSLGFDTDCHVSLEPVMEPLPRLLTSTAFLPPGLPCVLPLYGLLGLGKWRITPEGIREA